MWGGDTDRCADANFHAFFPADGEINRKRCGKFRLKSVIADRPDLCGLSVFRHNSQLTLTLEHPERPSSFISLHARQRAAAARPLDQSPVL